MQKKDIKIGTAYAIGRGSRNGWAAWNATEGYVLGPEPRDKTNSIVLKRFTDGRESVEAQVAYEGYTVENYVKSNVHATRYGYNYRSQAERDNLKAYAEAHPLPDGWYAETVRNADIWQDWASYVKDRDQFEAAQTILHAEQRAKRRQNEADKARIEQSLNDLGLKVQSYRVNPDARTVTLDFEQFDQVFNRAIHL